MKVTRFWVIGLTVLALAASPSEPSEAEPVPDRAIGIWSLGDCGDAGLSVLVNSTGALVVETEGGKTQVAIVKAEWAEGSFVLRSQAAEGDLVLPPLTQFQRCDFLPSPVSVPFAEAVALFKRMDEIQASCTGTESNMARCVAVAFDVIDITDDGLFSQAELSRALRAAGFLIGYGLAVDEQTEVFVKLEELYLGQIAGAALGPLVAGHLIRSYDFDGDGFLSLKELMQDRLPESALQGALANLAIQMPPGALSALTELLGGLDLLP